MEYLRNLDVCEGVLSISHINSHVITLLIHVYMHTYGFLLTPFLSLFPNKNVVQG